jgi:hypothetical protein
MDTTSVITGFAIGVGIVFYAHIKILRDLRCKHCGQKGTLS